MANRSLFSSFRGQSVPPANTVNAAGGLAYALSDEAALAQYSVTGCFNGTYYTDAGQQLDEIIRLAAPIHQ